MLTGNMIVGGLIGLVVTVGAMSAILWAALALTQWATKHARPADPRLDDEDEIDHRFY